MGRAEGARVCLSRGLSRGPEQSGGVCQMRARRSSKGGLLPRSDVRTVGQQVDQDEKDEDAADAHDDKPRKGQSLLF